MFWYHVVINGAKLMNFIYISKYLLKNLFFTCLNVLFCADLTKICLFLRRKSVDNFPFLPHFCLAKDGAQVVFGVLRVGKP